MEDSSLRQSEKTEDLQDLLQNSKKGFDRIDLNLLLFRKLTRYSQLGDDQAAKLYEERYRQIQSDMMKKLSQKKPVQKKFQSNPRSTSSLSTLTQSTQHIGNGIKQQGNLQRNVQVGNSPNSNGNNNIISKFSEKRPSSQLVQSTTQSRMATEENAPDYCLVKSSFRSKLKSQKSCDILTFSQDQLSNSSCQAAPSIKEQDIVLHHGYLNPNTFIKAQQKQKADSFISSPNHQQQFQQTSLQTSGETQMKSSKNMGKATQSQDKSTQPVLSSRLLQSPSDKKPLISTEKFGMNKGISSQTGSRHDTSPNAGRAYQAITAGQTFYSPQSTKGGSKTHRRKSIDERDSKRMKKAESNLSTFVRQTGQINKEEPSSTTQFHNFGFSNSTLGSTTSYLMRANLKSSLDYALAADANSKKIKNMNNQAAKRTEIQDIDLRIQTIEREIEKDGNKLAVSITKKNQQQQYNQPLSQGSLAASATSSMNSSKPSKSTMISSVDSKSISAPINENGTYSQKATLSKLSKNGDKSNGNQLGTNLPAKLQLEETKKDQIISNGTVSSPHGQSTYSQKTSNVSKQKKQTKAQQNSLRLQQNEGTFSCDHSSYNNTPRSADPMHDFRPFSKPSTSLSSRKQVNFKGEGSRFLTFEGEHKERNHILVTPSSPTTSKSQFTPFSSPMNPGVNSFVGQIGTTSLKKSCFLDSNSSPQAQSGLNANDQQESLQTNSEINNHSDAIANPQNSHFETLLSPGDPEISEFEYLEKYVNATQTDSSVVDEASELSNQHSNSAVNQVREITSKSVSQMPVKNGKTIQKKNSQEPTTLHSNSLDSSALVNQNKKHEQFIKSPGIISQSLRSSDIVSNSAGTSKPQHYNILISSGISATPANQRKVNGQQIKGGAEQNKLGIQIKENDASSLSKSTNFSNISSANGNNSNNGQQKQYQYQKKQQSYEQLKIKDNFISPSSPALHLQSNDERTIRDKTFSASLNGGSPSVVPHHFQNNLNTKNASLRTSSVNPNNISAASSTTPSSSLSQPTNYSNNEGYSKKQRESHAKIGNINSYQAKPLSEEKQLEGKLKKTPTKQARFEDEKQDYQLEQISKNLHKKLNLLLETANQCNENIKSYRINNNNNC